MQKMRFDALCEQPDGTVFSRLDGSSPGGLYRRGAVLTQPLRRLEGKKVITDGEGPKDFFQRGLFFWRRGPFNVKESDYDRAHAFDFFEQFAVFGNPDVLMVVYGGLGNPGSVNICGNPWGPNDSNLWSHREEPQGDDYLTIYSQAAEAVLKDSRRMGEYYDPMSLTRNHHGERDMLYATERDYISLHIKRGGYKNWRTWHSSLKMTGKLPAEPPTEMSLCIVTCRGGVMRELLPPGVPANILT